MGRCGGILTAVILLPDPCAPAAGGRESREGGNIEALENGEDRDPLAAGQASLEIRRFTVDPGRGRPALSRKILYRWQ